MSYTENVMAKLMNPGVLLLLLGACMVYGSAKLTKAVAHEEEGEKAERINVIIKIAGVVVAAAGAFMIFLKN